MKITLVIAASVLALFAGMFASCNHYHEVNAKAPVVETCVKHPVTESPFKQGY